MHCVECKREVESFAWITADGKVCDDCFNLYTNYNGEIDTPVKKWCGNCKNIKQEQDTAAFDKTCGDCTKYTNADGLQWEWDGELD